LIFRFQGRTFFSKKNQENKKNVKSEIFNIDTYFGNPVLCKFLAR